MQGQLVSPCAQNHIESGEFRGTPIQLSFISSFSYVFNVAFAGIGSVPLLDYLDLYLHLL